MKAPSKIALKRAPLLLLLSDDIHLLSLEAFGLGALRLPKRGSPALSPASPASAIVEEDEEDDWENDEEEFREDSSDFPKMDSEDELDGTYVYF